MRKTSKIVYIGLLVAQALVLHVFERMIPVPFITPGAKLGLANLMTVIALYTLKNKKDVFLVLFLRLTLGTMFGGNLSSFMYSAMGGIFSFSTMVMVKEIFKDKVSIIGVSVTGAIFHNVGQLVVASLLVKNIGVMLYLPMLSTIGIGTGVFIGIAANYIVNHLIRLPMFRYIKEGYCRTKI